MNDIFNPNSPGMKFLANVFNVFWVNLLFLFTCLPIITIGPSLCALYKVCLKMVSGEEMIIYREYFKEFKNSFKKGTILWLIFLAVTAFLCYDLYLLIWRHDLVSERFSFLLYPVCLLLIIVFQVFLYGFPLLATFENSLKNTIKNSILLSIQKLSTTLTLIVIWFFGLIIAILFPSFVYGLIGFELFFNLALRALCCSFFLHRVFGLTRVKTNRDGSVVELSYDDMIEEDSDDEDLDDMEYEEDEEEDEDSDDDIFEEDDDEEADEEADEEDSDIENDEE